MVETETTQIGSPRPCPASFIPFAAGTVLGVAVARATSADKAERVATEVFGGEPLSERSRAVLADLDNALHES